VVTKPLSVVLVVYNEAETIEREVRAFLDRVVAKVPGAELIVAEDGSTDGTTEILQHLAAETGLFHLSGRERKGYKRAWLDAIAATGGEWVFFSDTGLKHDPGDFDALWAARHQADLIVGRKTDRQDELHRRLLTWSYNAYLRQRFSIGSVFDADSGFRLFNRRVVDLLARDPLQFRGLVASEMVLRTIQAGLRYQEVPITYRGRAGESRGVPTRRIPAIIRNAITDVERLRRQWRP
jgi:glycosyltransferase involved in cell wall biosynthesis